MLRTASRGFVCDVLCHFRSQSEQSQRELIVDLVVDDGAKIGDGEKRTLLHRQRKSSKNNVMVSLSEVQKRLRAIEERKALALFAGLFVCFFFSIYQIGDTKSHGS